MLNGKENTVIDKGMSMLGIIWVSMLLTLFVYLLIAHVLGEGIRQSTNNAVPLHFIRNILIGAAIVTLLVSRFLRKALLGKSHNSGPAKTHDKQPVSGPNQILKRYTSVTIISLALCESIGIYGLILFFLGDSFQTLHILLGVAAAAMLFYRPKRRDLQTLAGESQIPGL
jgi:hypothetical protein